MRTYQLAVVLIKFVVDFLLLFGGGRLSGEPTSLGRCVLGAVVGAAFSCLSLLNGFYFLGNPLWRCVGILVMAFIAYRFRRGTIRCAAVFAILNLALGGISAGLGERRIFSLLAAAAGLAILCFFGFRKNGPNNRYVPVQITSGDTQLHLKALQDTGNMLTDPVTGRPVLVIGAEAAHKLTGLSREQLRRPIESIESIPGLRLIPYQTVGMGKGFMLARKYQNVSIGKWKGSSLIAFAPEGLNGDYEALTGGTV